MLREDGVLVLHPNEFYDQIGSLSLRAWCHLHARYGLPTHELVEFLQRYIGTRRTIEIGAGHGDLAYHLNIPATDNWSQTFPDVKLFYALTRQPVIQYPERVENLDATAAIEKYKPEVVIASWVTQRINAHEPPPPGGGSVYGVDEDQIIASGRTYMLIGNLAIHGTKLIMRHPHRQLILRFIRSRSAQPELNRIWIWNE